MPQRETSVTQSLTRHHFFQTLSPTRPYVENTLRLATSGTTTKEFSIMSKSNGNSGKGSSRGSNGGHSGNNLGAGGGRPSTGFQGGNWPSTTGNPSGAGRGNAPQSGKK